MFNYYFGFNEIITIVMNQSVYRIIIEFTVEDYKTAVDFYCDGRPNPRQLVLLVARFKCKMDIKGNYLTRLIQAGRY